MRKSTELIHTGERVTAGITPSLTTPIYETSTFIFESAAELQAYQEGRSSGYLYSRYDNPTVVATEQKLAVVDGAECVAALQLGTGGDDPRAADAAAARRRSGLQRRHLRRHASPDRQPAAAVRHQRPLRVAGGARGSRQHHRAAHQAGVVRVADQPDAALRRRARGGRRVQGRRRDRRSSTTPSRAPSTSRCCRWASTSRCRAPRSTSTATATSPPACSRARGRCSSRS